MVDCAVLFSENLEVSALFSVPKTSGKRNWQPKTLQIKLDVMMS